MNQNEPLTLHALLGTAINATVGVLAFVFNWSQEITALLLGCSGAWLAVGAYVFTRDKVTPVAVVDKVMENRGQEPILNQEYSEARKAG